MALTLERIQKAREHLAGVARRTPLVPSTTLTNRCGSVVWLKLENRQKTGSFKLRGAYNKICSLSEEERARGVIAASAGNHAQGVAYGATAKGIRSVIVMPETAPQAKVQATLGYGAHVVQHGEVYDECYAKALELQQESGASFIHPFDDEDVMAGQGTIALEILEDLPEAGTLLIPVGGGGLIAGMAVAARAIRPDIRIIGVQAAVVASTRASLEKRSLVTLPGVKSLADGISVATPGGQTFPYMESLVDDVITVTEEEISFAIFTLMERNKVVAEGAGAVGTAAILAGKVLSRRPVADLISGGNIDIAMVAKIIERELIVVGRRISFQVEIPDRVGKLGALINHIVSLGGNVVTTRQDRNWVSRGLDWVSVAFELEAQTSEHARKILDALRSAGYDLRTDYPCAEERG